MTRGLALVEYCIRPSPEGDDRSNWKWAEESTVESVDMAASATVLPSCPCKWVSRNERRAVSNCMQNLTIRANKVEIDTGKAQLVRDDLLGLIAGEERGLRTQRNSRKRDEIVKAIGALAALAVNSVTTDASLTAAWRMMWTTEKEQLFIVEKANIFGTEAGDILQIIDVEKNSLKNVITFPPTGLFLVDSTIQVVGAQRVEFKFIGASLKIGELTIPVPPFGQGWFESVYLDDMIRVAKDIRGDYLIVDRASTIPEGL